MVSVHLSVSKYSEKFEQSLRRKNHVTPKNFLDYINIYKKVCTIIALLEAYIIFSC